MTTLSQALVDLVNSFAGVTALIGVSPMRFYPTRLPTTPQPPIYPAITYQKIDDNSVYAHSGYSGLINARIQLTIWAKTDNSASLVEMALRAMPPLGLNGYRGVVSGLQFDRIFIVSGPSSFEETTQVHQRIMDLLIGYVG